MQTNKNTLSERHPTQAQHPKNAPALRMRLPPLREGRQQHRRLARLQVALHLVAGDREHAREHRGEPRRRRRLVGLQPRERPHDVAELAAVERLEREARLRVEAPQPRVGRHEPQPREAPREVGELLRAHRLELPRGRRDGAARPRARRPEAQQRERVDDERQRRRERRGERARLVRREPRRQPVGPRRDAEARARPQHRRELNLAGLGQRRARAAQRRGQPRLGRPHAERRVRPQRAGVVAGPPLRLDGGERCGVPRCEKARRQLGVQRRERPQRAAAGLRGALAGAGSGRSGGSGDERPRRPPAQPGEAPQQVVEPLRVVRREAGGCVRFKRRQPLARRPVGRSDCTVDAATAAAAAAAAAAAVLLGGTAEPAAASVTVVAVVHAGEHALAQRRERPGDV